MATPWALLGTSAVALLAFVVAGAARRSMIHSGNPSVGYVAAAFLVLGAKSAIKLALLARDGGVGESWEAAFVAADVAMVGLVAWPLLRRRDP